MVNLKAASLLPSLKRRTDSVQALSGLPDPGSLDGEWVELVEESLRVNGNSSV